VTRLTGWDDINIAICIRIGKIFKLVNSNSKHVLLFDAQHNQKELMLDEGQDNSLSIFNSGRHW
jgi:hypothetical protein